MESLARLENHLFRHVMLYDLFMFPIFDTFSFSFLFLES